MERKNQRRIKAGAENFPDSLSRKSLPSDTRHLRHRRYQDRQPKSRPLADKIVNNHKRPLHKKAKRRLHARKRRRILKVFDHHNKRKPRSVEHSSKSDLHRHYAVLRRPPHFLIPQFFFDNLPLLKQP